MGCAWLIDGVLDWMSGFIDTLYTPLGTTGNYSNIALSTLYSSPIHTHKGSQPLLVLSWQRIHNSPTATAAHYEVFFSQPNSFLAIYSQLFCKLATQELDSNLILAAWDSSLYSLRAAPIENTVSSIVAYWLTAAEMCLPHRCLTSARRGPTENAACNTSSIVAWRHSVRDAFLCCMCTGHYLATAVSLPPQFLLRANTPQ
jgi:hypothetical protein